MRKVLLAVAALLTILAALFLPTMFEEEERRPCVTIYHDPNTDDWVPVGC